MSSTNRENFSSLLLICILLTSSYWVEFLGLCQVRVIRVDILVLFPVLGESVQSSTTKYEVICRFSIVALCQVKEGVLYSYFLRVFFITNGH